MTPKELANSTLRNFNEAIRRGDAEDMGRLSTQTGFFIATDDSEQWSMPEACKKLQETFEKDGRGWRLDPIKREVRQIESGIYTFFEQLEHPAYGPMRASGVCVQNSDGLFRVAEYVLSCSVPNKALEGKNLAIYMELVEATQ